GPHLLQASGVGGGDGRNTELRLARMHTACLGPQGLVLFPLEGGLRVARSFSLPGLGISGPPSVAWAPERSQGAFSPLSGEPPQVRGAAKPTGGKAPQNTPGVLRLSPRRRPR